jgi:ribosomal protein S18 acetylase RimI-like enzyme
MEIRSYHPADERAVIDLWQQCALVVPQNDPRRDIARKCQIQPELFLVGVREGTIVATCMAGYEGHRGWINYLAVSPAHRRRGFARQIMQTAEARLRALGCPKINLQVRATNAAVIAFYRAIGFAVDDVVSLGKRLEPDHE